MIVDSSAFVAIALTEVEADGFVGAIGRADVCRVSAGTWIELTAVAVRRRLFSIEWLERIAVSYRLTIEPVTVEQARIGHHAYRTFGLGTGHRARLNFGDCFSYALAKATGEPLLFKGDDFVHTDLNFAPY